MYLHDIVAGCLHVLISTFCSDWQCSSSGEHLAYVGEVDDDFANSNDPVDEDSTKP